MITICHIISFQKMHWRGGKGDVREKILVFILCQEFLNCHFVDGKYKNENSSAKVNLIIMYFRQCFDVDLKRFVHILTIFHIVITVKY